MATTFTNNFGFDKPATGDAGWGPLRNTNMDDLDAELFKPRIGQQALTWGATTTVDLSLARVFTGTNTQISTIAFANVPSTFPNGAVVPVVRCTLVITNGNAFAITWPASVTWLAGVAPTLRTAGVDIIDLVTRDGGTTWYGALRSANALRAGASTTALLVGGTPASSANTTTTASGAGASANLKSYAIPAAVLNKTNDAIRIRGWGTAANNANAKTINLNLNGVLVISVTIQASLLDHWYIEATIYRQSATTADVHSTGRVINSGTVANRVAMVTTNLDTVGDTLQFYCTQTSAGDVTQEGLSVEWIGAA